MKAEMKKTLPAVFAACAASHPDRLFAADSAKKYTYAQALERAAAAACYLKRTLCVKKGDRVLIICDQSADYLVTIMACGLAGALFVPVEQNASADRLKEIFEDTQSVLLIAGSSVDGYNCASFSELLEAPSSDAAFELPEPQDESEILFTTGTTGKSKGIVMTFGADYALAENVRTGVEMREGCIELIPLAMSHSHGLRTFYAAVLNGGAVVLTDGVMNVRGVFHMMEEHHVTALDLSPSAAQILVRLSKGAFWQAAKDLDYIEIGTAALPEELKEQLIANLPGVRLYNFYGSTESGRTCVLEFSKYGGRKSCIGHSSVNAEIVFTDDDRKPVKATKDNPGLLASRGPMNMKGYWKNEELTGTILIDGFVCTNDLGYIDDEGFIYVIGRRDDVINYNGLKIAPSEIEEVVGRYPGVVESACVGKSDPVAGQIPWLYVAAENGDDFDMNGFTAYLQQHLDGTKMPKVIRLINELPRTYNGKLDRKQLVQLTD